MLFLTELSTVYPEDGTFWQRGQADSLIDERLMPDLRVQVAKLAEALVSGYSECEPDTALELATQDAWFGIVGMVGEELGKDFETAIVNYAPAFAPRIPAKAKRE